jgi:mannan endo-1,4-beta-mannosidase
MAKAKPRPAAAILLRLIFLAAAAGAVPWRQNGLPAAAGAGSDAETTGGGGLVGVDGTRFVVGGGGCRPIYFSGFNAYWLMLVAADPARRGKVVAAFRQAADHGLNLARTWAFSDGGETPLQAAPGVYDEAMFQVATVTTVTCKPKRDVIVVRACRGLVVNS